MSSIEADGSALDKFYWLNEKDPNCSYKRATESQGEKGGIDPRFALGNRGQNNLMQQAMALPKDLYDKRVNEVISKRFSDSNQMFSWTISRQAQFSNRPDDQTVVWFHGLFGDPEGNFIKKPLRECTGEEITKEWLWHIGVPEDEIDELASEENGVTRPCTMPLITAFFTSATARTGRRLRPRT